MPAVEVQNLRKTFGPVVAVDDLTFEVETGSLFAFLGANGAGKSTTIGCITTTLSPTSGDIHVNGHDVVSDAFAVRRAIGAVFQQSVLDPMLTVRENLLLRAGFYGIDGSAAAQRVEELTRLIGLDDFVTRHYGRLSGGQKRRADIARAIIHRPSTLFLDEPTAGLDPQSREQIWDALTQLRQEQGMTVFLTTHYMEETERADQVCIIEKGQIVAQGTPAALRAEYSSSVLTVRAADADALIAQCATMGVDAVAERDHVRISVQSAAQAKELITRLDPEDFEFRHGTMDDVFLTVTGREAP